MSTPTFDDANVMLQLARWGSEFGLEEASIFLWSDDFEEDFEAFSEKYPQGTQQDKYVSQICAWFETMGALWVNGLLNEQLISDWVAVEMIWERIKNYALGNREKYGNPRIFEHFESLAKALANR